MAATGYSPIQLYYSTTASAAPTAGNLASGELAINITDGKLYYKDNAGAVQLLSTSTTANGTANGVLYLNGSKVATAGSALVFDGTNLGVGVTPSAWSGRTAIQLPDLGYFVTSGSSLLLGSNVYFNGSSRTYITTAAAADYRQINGEHRWEYAPSGTAGTAITFTQAMTLDSSGNLGIGTTSPGYKLDVAGASGVAINIANTGDSNRGGRIVVAGSSASGTVALNTTSSGYGITFGIDSTEKMRLDSSGNLGLGVTPSAWLANSQAIQNSSGALWQYGGANIYLGQNYYLNGSVQRIYATSAAATEYNQAGGAHRWYTAPSGTAGNPISFTQAMTLDASGNLGIGTSSPSSKLHVVGTSHMNVGAYANGYALTISASSETSRTYQIGMVTGGNLAIYDSASSATRLTLDTSGNLGIGTSSPARRLVVQATDASTNTKYIVSQFNRASSGTAAAGVGGQIQFQAQDDAGTQREAAIIGWDLSDVSAASPKGRLFLGSRGVNDAVVIDNSGNLGLGVTPSFVNGYTVYQVKDAALCSSGSSDLELSVNAYYNSGWKYKNTFAASRYEQYNGVHAWFNAASGTAGAAITFTQAMTLDASGNLGVGTTSPSNAGNSNNRGITLNGNGTAGFVELQSSGTVYGLLYGNSSEVQLRTATAIPLLFGTNGSERARIDSSGNLLVGTTATGYTNADSFTLEKANGYQVINHSTSRTSGSGYILFGYNTGGIGSITQNGTTGVLYNITSDQRLKENIQDADSASGLIDSLKVRKYNWKSDGSHQRYGFVAQELVTVAPEAVYQPADPEEMMAVDYSKLVPMLVKEIQSLRARVAQLESN